jgi:two-component system LytT family response regulator
MKAIIVDDEEKSAELLQLKLARFCPEVQVVQLFTDATTVTDYISKHPPDIVFLDIEMPQVDGLNIARQIKDSTEIVFVTAYEKYSIEALRIAVLDYLLKPVNEDDLKHCISRLQEKMQQKKKAGEMAVPHAAATELRKINTRFDKIALPTLEGVHFINIRDIIRVESESNYSIFFFTDKRKMVVSKTLKQVEELLEPYNFYRPHKSHIVNIDYVTKYIRGEGGTIRMNDGSEVEVSRTKKNEFLELMGLG